MTSNTTLSTAATPSVNPAQTLPGQSFEYHDMTLIPVRCFTCAKVIGGMQRPYEAKLAKGIPQGQALTELGLVRSCCRTNVSNPPAIPLGLQVANDDAKITALYNQFGITPERVAAYTSSNVQPTTVNLSGNRAYNPQPLSALNRPKRIYELTKRKQVTLVDPSLTNTVSNVTELLGQLNELDLELE